jgi:pyruvate,water dikinase
MKTSYTLPLGSPQADHPTVGGKGASLARLVTSGFPVPGGFHVTTDAYRQFVITNQLQPQILQAIESADLTHPQSLEAASKEIHKLFTNAEIPVEITNEVNKAYSTLSGDSIPVAVRSSATAEDLPEASFAGQQETYLNLRGAKNVLTAVRECWASLWTGRAISYRSHRDIDPDQVAIAVVIQTLIPAEAAGILFTANPINGDRGQVVISASWGLGEAVVGGLVTPDSLTLEKSSGRVMDRQITDKHIQTIQTKSGTREEPVPEHLRSLPALSDDGAAELCRLGVQIETHFGFPLDIEWALAKGKFSILQARPITALPAPPLIWEPPDPKGTYLRTSVVDLMPDPLSPLFVSLGIPAFKCQMIPLGKRIIGSEPVLADDYFTSINSYAYMNSAYPPKAIWWILTGLIPSYPRLLGQLIPVWRDEILPEYKAFAASFEGVEVEKLAADELWQDALAIVDAAMYYVCGLMFATMGASAGSEGLLTQVYNRLIKREGDPPAAVLLMGWDNIPVQAEKSLYDLATWCRQRPDLAAHILETETNGLVAQLRSEATPSDIDPTDWGELRERFQLHLAKYGHIIYQLDFAHTLQLDHPEPMLGSIKMYLAGQGSDPYKRQHLGEVQRLQTGEKALTRLSGLKRWVFKKALKFGQTMAEVREDALAEIGLGYPALRRRLLELGKRFAAAGLVAEAGDIFWLEVPEIEICLANLPVRETLAPLTGAVSERKAFWERAKAETPPPMMPVKERIMGIKVDAFIAHAGETQTGDILKGVPASAGEVTASACVLHGPEDFAKMQPGKVLVAATTTPAWTPLFAMASAVVTDIGGPLSHGSIVAREFGIPAVMGTGVATKRIQNGQKITVNGTDGTVKLT